ncbi:MAG: hypothetical protein CMP86_10925, partial [Gammaproteobacteria bacterium]|nr:hypothetical protein [Gammaproteobacteria bacterium]
WRKPKKRQASVPVMAKVISCASGRVKIKKISPVKSQLAAIYSISRPKNWRLCGIQVCWGLAKQGCTRL